MKGQLSWGRQEVDGWRKGPWTTQEDKLLIEHVRQHGEGRWNSVSKHTGLKRGGKSCRLRWVNYLRSDLKRGKITPQEESVIVQLHALWGNRWSTIARRLPGRTDNEIKNYWRTHFKKGRPSKNMERARARFLNQRREMQTQQQLQLVGKDENNKHDDDATRAGTVEDDRGSAVVGVDNACAAATTAAVPDQSGHHQTAADLVMHDAIMDFMCPLSSCSLLHGAGTGSCCGSTNEEDGATWGSLWNLEDVVVGACTLW